MRNGVSRRVARAIETRMIALGTPAHSNDFTNRYCRTTLGRRPGAGEANDARSFGELIDWTGRGRVTEVAVESDGRMSRVR